MKWIPTITLLVLLPGCGSLIPKSVEFGQKKVREFPDHSINQREVEKQAVALAADRAREAEKLAHNDGSSAEIPAGEAAELSESVSRSLGPPLAPWKKEAASLVLKLDNLTAKYDSLVERFKERNDELAGKKIEGTGIVSVPYFLYLGIVGGVILIVWLVLKTVVNVAAAGNPGVAVGLKVAQVGGKALSRGFSQVIAAGEAFKERIKKEVPDANLQRTILEAFRTAQESKQDSDVQTLVKELTK